MNYVSNPTEEQRQAWAARAKEQEEQMQALVKDMAESFHDSPEDIAELLSFGSKFYQYSVRNNMLIYKQNPHATYTQSYKAWKDMGYSIRKGEKGLKVYVPVQATILKDDGKLVPLEQATKEQKIKYKAGEIESITQTRFKLGTVFDIAQTNYPKELLPRLYFMGYPSEVHKDLVSGLTEYAKNFLDCEVRTEDLKSISLRGGYSPGLIRLNEQLEDTQKLSTLAHEMGHAMMQHEYDNYGKSSAQKELEADALGIMVEGHFGIEPTETRKRHLSENYRAYEAEYQEHPEKESFGEVLKNVFSEYRQRLPEMEQTLERYVPVQRMQAQKQTSRQQEISQERQNKVYDEIKEQVQIVDYAASHGFHVQRAGHYYTLAEHDSVRIDPDRNCFWRNSGIGTNTQGSVIDFAAHFVHNGDLHESLKELGGMIRSAEPMAAPISSQRQHAQGQSITPENRIKTLNENLPKRAENMHRAYAYLTKSRHIDQDIVQDFVNRKMLYQDVRGNCVFTARNQEGEINFATFRGTLTERKFLGDVAGCDYNRGFYINNNADKLIVTESVIDAMSVMSILKGQGVDQSTYDYLVLTGTQKQEAILTHLAEHPKQEVLLALDHDLAGVKGMKEIQDMIQASGIDTQITFHVPSIEQKDWNGDLVQASKNWKSMDTVPFLEDKPLPAIHYCAAQSTEQIEEKGFRMRGEKHQYRLVELMEDGSIQPIDINRNVIYYSEKELEELVPSMYERVSYDKLEQMQEDVQASQNRQEETQTNRNRQQEALTDAGRDMDTEQTTAGDGIGQVAAAEILIENGMYAARVVIDGEEDVLGIRKRGEEFLVETGYAFDDSLKEYRLDGESMEELKSAMEGIDPKTLPDGMVFQADAAGSEIGMEPNMDNLNTSQYLERLSRQELQKNATAQLQAGVAVGLEL